ncbi:hypothetical protein BDV41DRAFT_567101 [Aspergillus transmontanensis]|uniref:Aminoglycoside phosphotransferase domain-containing protein n=1 Tax=Aspergillus transmontanensis TaxID=1034304 RepID=A0A5N6VMJ5_9EURO|nr:hypothetical protein BDV41DRAFT_567101 [Aspergillus transmontanensis]
MSALPIGGKPEPPYTVGWRCTVHSHEPPRPALVTKDSCRISLLNDVLRHPLLPGLDKPRNVDLEIIEVKKGGDNHDSQVVIVEVLGHIQRLKKGRRAVAKFYDPLYFDDDEGFLNPFACVDRHYTHESAAYITLVDLMGKKIAEFYGSFSVSIPVDESHTRTVRLILLEYISGKPMLAADPEDYNQLSRQVLLKSAIDFETGLVFLDFGGALFGRIRDDAVAVAYRVNLSLETYISPLLRWAKLPSDFDQWVDWD